MDWFRNGLIIILEASLTRGAGWLIRAHFTVWEAGGRRKGIDLAAFACSDTVTVQRSEGESEVQ